MGAATAVDEIVKTEIVTSKTCRIDVSNTAKLMNSLVDDAVLGQ